MKAITPPLYPRPLLKREKGRPSGTGTQSGIRGRPSGFRPDREIIILPGLRATARKNGIPPSTLKRWSESHVKEVGLPLIIANAMSRVDSIEARINAEGASSYARKVARMIERETDALADARRT